MHLRPLLLFILAAASLIETRAAVSPEYQTATQARLSGGYIMVVFASGTKAMVPVASLKEEDKEWLVALTQKKPMAESKGKVTVVANTSGAPAKKTIVTSSVEGPLETVQLCPPNVLRDQIGGTCMLYARIHYLDIGGYYTQTPDIYKIINETPSDAPWLEQRYVDGLFSVFTRHSPKPVRHPLPPEVADPFEWARSELRKGRPLLAAFPRAIWQALPPGYVASRPWSGGNVGHQIVVNGFTWNKETRQGTFRIVNSWAELPEFDLSTRAAENGNLVFEESLSPFGEIIKTQASVSDKERVTNIRLIRPAGAVNLYEVTTTHGTRRMAAANEDAVRRLVEETN